MTDFWPVGKNKFVGVIQPTGDAPVAERKHHIWIEDQSGSMGWAVETIAKDICKHLHEVPYGDWVSIGYFSGVGDFRWFVKGSKIVDDNDYASLCKIITDNARSRNTTCFSQILADVEKVISDIAPFTDTVELVFLTDGHPVVPSYEQERKSIFTAIKNIRDKVSTALIVGYGDYYNRELLVEMAKSLGATLQHAEEVTDFGKKLGEIVVKTGRKRTTITLPVGASAAFAIENGRVVVYSVDDRKVVAPQGLPVYFVSNAPSLSSGANQQADPYQAQYALALLNLQDGKVDEALEVLGEIGDVAIVNRLGSAITNKEFGDVEEMIQSAVTDLSKRFLLGQKKGCAPKADAFDLISVLNLLQNDEKAKFYPYHDEFKYKRIGRSSVPVPGYPKFVADKSIGVPVSGLVGNANELNISIGISIPGTVDLPEESGGYRLSEVGLPQTYPVHIFRTYNIIANALPNVSKLPVSVGYDTFLVLHENGLIDVLEKWEEGKIFVLDLLSVPACNRQRGEQAANFELLARNQVDSEVLGNELKVFKAKLTELDPDKKAARPATMTEAQQAFLAGVGIKPDGTYNAPTTQGEATDVLSIRTFSIKVAKSSPVSLKDFEAMVAGTKKLNIVGEQMMLAQEQIDSDMPKQAGAAILWLTNRVEDLKREKRNLDAEIASAKYAIALGGHWRKMHATSTATYAVSTETWPDAEVTFEFHDNVEKKI